MHLAGRALVLLVAAMAVTPSAAVLAADAPPPPGVSPSGSFQFAVHPYADPGAPQRSDFSYDLAAGQTFTDRVVITNPADQPKSFYVYASDVYNAQVGGALAVHQKEEPRTDAAAWVQLPAVQDGQLTVPPNSGDVLNVVVTVPPDASPGDHTAAIVAEEILAPTTVPNGAGVKTVHRVASRMDLRIKGPIHPSLLVEQFAVSHHDATLPGASSSARVTFILVNSGNVRAKLSEVRFELTGVFGRKLHDTVLKRLPPGQVQGANGLPDEIVPRGRIAFGVTFHGLPLADAVTAHVRVSAEDPIQHGVIATARTTTFFVIPWLFAGIVLLLALAYGAWRFGWGRAGPGPSPNEPGPGNVPSDQWPAEVTVS